ncbi:MAG: flagellar basal body P-ring formation chaperone FlgA [Acidobacteria bacterium]|nr:flagellar basal body P-ring formation chaperone FlgA [Acidobacteriota bacterium]
MRPNIGLCAFKQPWRLAWRRAVAGGALLVLLGISPTLAAEPPELPEQSEVPELIIERDRITAGQLARVIPAWAVVEPTTFLAYAPRPGAHRQIARAKLMSWGRDHGLDLDQDRLPASVLVRRATRRLGHAEALDLVLRNLAAGLQLSTDDIHVKLEGYRPALLPAGKLEFELPQGNLVFNRLTPLAIEWRDTDGRTGRVMVRASVAIDGQYAVAKRDLPTGTEIGPDDFDFEEGALPGAPQRFVLSPPDVSGMELRSSLLAGRPLDRRLLVVAETIERGDLIQIRLRFGDVVLQTPARAEESGSVGERIQCRNLDSGRRIVARVISPKLAEVSEQ